MTNFHCRRFCVTLTPISALSAEGIASAIKNACERHRLNLFCTVRSGSVLVVCGVEIGTPIDIALSHVRRWLTKIIGPGVGDHEFELTAVRCVRDSTADPSPTQWLYVNMNNAVFGVEASATIEEHCSVSERNTARPEPVFAGAGSADGELRPVDSM